MCDSVLHGMANDFTEDFLTLDIRQSLHYLGKIPGTITTEYLLVNIFEVLYRKKIHYNASIFLLAKNYN